ncbi:MAG: sigma-70 family RNA polymerase sigma factor [Oscillospiraceae bacterium]|nr:sigma-70 family RNA polymerase sigma factor [Oscillospiraceae bacterium]
MKNSLLTKIIDAQKNHEEDLVQLINDFTPLLKKYATKMNGEDAFADLRLEFIEIILGINAEKFSNYVEPQILSYIKISVHNAYIKLSKRKCEYENNTFPVEDIRDEIEKSHCDEYENVFLEDLKKYLTENEFDVIYKHFFCGLTINDIALIKGVSRQAVNQVKARAIKKLSGVFEKE